MSNGRFWRLWSCCTLAHRALPIYASASSFKRVINALCSSHVPPCFVILPIRTPAPQELGENDKASPRAKTEDMYSTPAPRAQGMQFCNAFSSSLSWSPPFASCQNNLSTSGHQCPVRSSIEIHPSMDPLIDPYIDGSIDISIHQWIHQ